MNRDWRWFCCGWWRPLCVVDTVAHRLKVTLPFLCDAHDDAIWKRIEA